MSTLKDDCKVDASGACVCVHGAQRERCAVIPVYIQHRANSDPVKKKIVLIVTETSLRISSSSSSCAFLLDEWLNVWRSSPSSHQKRKVGRKVGGHRWPDIALASRSEALTWQRQAAGARIAAADSGRLGGQSHRWRREPLAPRSRGSSGSRAAAASMSRDFRAPVDGFPLHLSTGFPSTMRATRI